MRYAILLLLAACTSPSDDSAETDTDTDSDTDAESAYDLEGTWLLQETLFLPNGSSEPVEVTPESAPYAAVGDLMFTATSDTTGEASWRLFVTEDSLPVPEEGTVYTSLYLYITLDGTNWTQDITTSGDGQPISLEWSLADGGDTLDLSGTLWSRSEPMSTHTIGDWQYRSMTIGSQTFGYDDCVAWDSGWAQYHFILEIVPDHSGMLLATRNLYSDDQCTVGVGTEEISKYVYTREWGDRFEFNNRHGWFDYDMTVGNDELTLDWSSCKPTPGCEEAGLPDQVVLEPQPS